MAKNKKKKNKTNKTNKPNKQRDIKDFFSMKEVLVITVMAIIFGWFMGSIITSKTAKVNESEDIKKFTNVYNHIANNYYKKVDRKKLVESAINGMLNDLDDPYTSYMDEEETDSFNRIMDGEYKGVGVSIVKYKEDIIIIGAFKGSPAQVAGIKAGDIILEIDGKSFKNKDADDVIKEVQNKKEIEIKIKRKEEEKTFKIKVKKVEIPSVSSEVIEKNGEKVGVISISVFALNTSTQFKKELQSLEKKNIKSYILDLRSNPGGYLTEATNILSEFMDSSHVIYQIKTKKRTEKFYSEGKKNKNYKVVVLLDENSASASEVVAAALKESYGATIVGKKSYGKGTVQRTAKITGGGTIKYTIENWLTPKGNYINKKGIEPSVEVDLNEDYYDEPTNDNDNQLQKALELITKK